MAGVDASPWHAGERAVRERVGERDVAAHATGAVRADVPPVAARFLADQPVLFVAAADGASLIWVTALPGEPGFLTVPRPDVLAVAARPSAGDPLAGVLAGPANVGTIAIEPMTRRRTRLNGQSLPTTAGLHVQLAQVFANCPKYIQRRSITRVEQPTAAGAPDVGSTLTERQQRWVATTDTFFIGTASATGDVDASHRGGNPGFVEVVAPDRLRFPDYRGNSFYMTLGNLEQNPAIGLLFIDWAAGSTLQLSGSAVVRYEQHVADWPDGALRMVDVSIDRVVELTAVLPLRAPDAEPSRFNPPIERTS